MRQILSITRKELDSYFGSPMATIFLGAFLAVTLFTFFWVETFFARGIADLRPLFDWMPLLLIFLVSTLTMRQWSEEQRAGTLEMLLTLPIGPLKLVLGKFLAVMALVALALILTLPLPITVSQLGNLDWGPVLSGYLAALLLAAAYAAIGLFISSRTDNQIVALIATALVGGLFYLVGTSGATDFVDNQVGALFRALGTGSRFASIQRGVIDLRDLAYYLSLTGIFLTLNVLSLTSKRWSGGGEMRSFRRREALAAGLLSLNLVLANVWLYPLQGLRIDVTESRLYSLSQTTRDLLANIQEPLLIRAYISQRTHPLLAPLAPSIADMLAEYQVAGGSLVTAEVVDPTTDPDLEAEANQTYGIQPTPFQVTDRYEAAVVNSYFDILIRYGDQDVVLPFDEIIEVTSNRDGTVDVRLRNLEYDLTRAIKQVVYGFQSIDTLLAGLESPAQLTLYVTRESLPAELADAPETIAAAAQDLVDRGKGNFTYSEVDPDADSTVTRQTLREQYGLQPFPVSFFSDQDYYLHLVLAVGDKVQAFYPSSNLSQITIRTAIESALMRNSAGFLRTVGLWTPPATPTTNMFGQPQQPISSYNLLTQQLGDEYNVRPVDLTSGQAPGDVDVLVVVAPQNMTDKERFAIDQYLMQGGSLVVAAGNYVVTPDMFTGSLGIQAVNNGLRDLLLHYGVDVQQALVMDPQNEPFPVVVNRQVQGFQVQEYQAIPYPFFVDVRPEAMDRENVVASNLAAVTLNWASPVVLDEAANAGRTTSVLLRSTDASWLRTDTNIQPDLEQYPELGFAVEGEQQSYPLAVSIQGRFESYFAGKPSPWAAEAQPDTEALDAQPTAEANEQPPAAIDYSPETARLLVVGSAEFVDDIVLQISSSLNGQRYLNNLLLMQNAVDWSVEDLDLLTIRARGNNVRVLDPLSPQQQSGWEFANYAVALVALLGVALFWRWRRTHERPLALKERSLAGDLSMELGD